MLSFVFKLGQCAEDNWRRIRGFNHLAKVIAGIQFRDGVEVTKTTVSSNVADQLPHTRSKRSSTSRGTAA